MQVTRVWLAISMEAKSSLIIMEITYEYQMDPQKLTC